MARRCVTLVLFDVRSPNVDEHAPAVDVDAHPPDIEIDINSPAPMAPALAEPGPAIFALPVALSPQLACGAADSDHCDGDAPEGEAHDSLTSQFAQAMAAVAGVPTTVVATCREGIIKAARAYDPSRSM